jgi:hypothetical protein
MDHIGDVMCRAGVIGRDGSRFVFRLGLEASAHNPAAQHAIAVGLKHRMGCRHQAADLSNRQKGTPESDPGDFFDYLFGCWRKPIKSMNIIPK